MSYPTVSCSMVPAYFTTRLSTRARVTISTRKLLTSPPDKSMWKINESEPSTGITFSFSLGTETYTVSVGWASLRPKVMGLTERSAFVAPRIFSLHVGRRFSCTAMFIMQSTIKFFKIQNENIITQSQVFKTLLKSPIPSMPMAMTLPKTMTKNMSKTSTQQLLLYQAPHPHQYPLVMK